MNKNKDKILEKIVLELTQARPQTRADLAGFKRRMAKKYRIPLPKNTLLLKAYHKLLKEKRGQKECLEIRYLNIKKPAKSTKTPQCLDIGFLNIENLLCKRPVRSLSGIVNVSVLTKPWPCPGKCIFCPEQKGVPKSYLEKEPAVQRAILNKYHPYKQAMARLESLAATGHPTDKIELRIIGATWSCYPRTYQNWFVKECFCAANKFAANEKCKMKNEKLKLKIQNLEQTQKANEGTKSRIIGITIETRPDYINIDEIQQLRKLGITRVELGVQSIYDDMLKLNRRGHSIKETIKATQLLKQAGFKVSYQIMPDLPGSTLKKDKEMFKELFSDPDFMPDALKIYPLALVKEAPLYKWYKQGKYRPYSQKQLSKLLLQVKQYIPRWCRVERIIRDIPSTNIIEGGAKKTNLREIVQKQMAETGQKCRCIRCREVGADYNVKEKLYLFREDYPASGDKEVFLSFENKARTRLYAILRLRLPCPGPRPDPGGRGEVLPMLKNAALVRELHTYGPATALGQKGPSQHRGLGKQLIKQAEKISRQTGLPKIAIISGIGVRTYYRKLSYRLKNTYMLKTLQ